MRVKHMLAILGLMLCLPLVAQANRGIEKSQIKITFDIEEGKKGRMAELAQVAMQNEKSKIVVSIDLNQDGYQESFVIEPLPPDPTGSLGSNRWILSESTANSVERKVIRPRDSQSGLATGRRIMVSTSTDSEGIEGQTGSLVLSQVSETAMERKHVANIKWSTMSISIGADNPEVLSLFRKGWDGTVKGGKLNISVVDTSGNTLTETSMSTISGQGVVSLCSGVPCPN